MHVFDANFQEPDLALEAILQGYVAPRGHHPLNGEHCLLAMGMQLQRKGGLSLEKMDKAEGRAERDCYSIHQRDSARFLSFLLSFVNLIKYRLRFVVLAPSAPNNACGELCGEECEPATAAQGLSCHFGNKFSVHK